MKRFGPLLLLSFFLAGICAQPALSFYKWVDEKGQLHVTDSPPPSKTQPESSSEPVPAKPAAPAPVPSAVPRTAETRTIPSTATKPSSTAAVPATSPSVTASSAATSSTPSAAVSPAPVPVPAPARPSAPRTRELPVSEEDIKALAGGLLMVFVVVGLVFYVYYSFCMYRIAKKLNVAEAWMSWVPILNLWPFLSSAGKPCWWVILLFVPLVNFFVIIYLWMCICENLGRNKWLGLLVLLDGGTILLPGILAFSGKE